MTAGIDVGKYDGSEGRLTVKSGRLFANTIFVSGGGGPGMRGRGTVEIRSLPHDLNLANTVNAEGYTRLEEYLNSLVLP